VRADDGEKRLVAYYAGRAPVAPEALRTQLAQRLPEYMLPAAFVQLDALPLTTNGKVDRRALPAPAAGAYASMPYAPPQGEIETALAAIWARLLKLERVSRHDNFFHLGGHSLLAVRTVTAIRDALGVELSIRDVFACAVLTELADRVVQADLAQFDEAELAALLGSIDAPAPS
jgi:acyl carrier protein